MLSSKERKAITIILVLGFTYALIVRYTPFCIPCFFQTVTGLKCPGCGITHVFMSLMDLDLYGAFHANRFLFVTSPILLLILILNKFYQKSSLVKLLSVFYIILLLVWGVVRNILQI